MEFGPELMPLCKNVLRSRTLMKNVGFPKIVQGFKSILKRNILYPPTSHYQTPFPLGSSQAKGSILIRGMMELKAEWACAYDRLPSITRGNSVNQPTAQGIVASYLRVGQGKEYSRSIQLLQCIKLFVSNL